MPRYKFPVPLLACVATLGLCSTPALADRKAAELAEAEGWVAQQAADWSEAWNKYSKVIEEDPTWWRGYARRAFASRGLRRQIMGLDDIATAIRLSSEESLSECEAVRLMLLMDLARWSRMAQDAPAAVTKWPSDRTLLTMQGLARIETGQIDEGLSDLEKVRKSGQASDTLEGIAVAHVLKADPESAVRTFEEMRNTFGHIAGQYCAWLIVAKMQTGDAAGAIKEFNGIFQSEPKELRIHLARAYLYGSPKLACYDPAGSVTLIRAVQSESGLTEAYWMEARTLYLAGRYSEAISAIERGGMEEDFWNLFWKGLSLLKLSRFSDARVIFTEARRRNPYFSKHFKDFPEAQAFAAQIDRDVARQEQRAGGRLESRLALALRRLTIPEIEALATTVRFRQGKTEYAKLPLEEFSPATADRVTQRIAELSGAADALDKLVTSINTGMRNIELSVGANKLKLTSADDQGFSFTIAKGSGRFPWSSVDPWELYCLMNEEKLTSQERLGAAAFLWDAGEIRRSSDELSRGSLRSPDMKHAFDESIALRKGVPIPEGGFVCFKGEWVTPEEKTNLEKGLVFLDGAWVMAADRDKLKKGLLKDGDKWVSRADKELLDRGWRKENGAWISPEDYVLLHQDWKKAWEAESEHFRIKTNVSESVLNSLSALLESALSEMRAWHSGGEVRPAAGKKIQVCAFRTFADYRTWCEKAGALDQLNAAGFAQSNSDTIVGWNKTDNELDLLATISHELEHYVSFRLHAGIREPSWFAEGTATYFEGLKLTEGKWQFHGIVEARLQLLQSRLASGKPLDLEGLLKKNALDLVKTDPLEAVDFYSKAWALVYYLENCGDSKTRKAFDQFKKGLWTGGSPELKSQFPDLKSLEAAVTKFVQGL